MSSFACNRFSPAVPAGLISVRGWRLPAPRWNGPRARKDFPRPWGLRLGTKKPVRESTLSLLGQFHLRGDNLQAQRLAAPDLPPCSGPRRRLAIQPVRSYRLPMPRKPIELPPEVAQRFLEDMRAYFAEKNSIKRDEIAGGQMHALREYQGPREKPLRIPDIMELFRQMREH